MASSKDICSMKIPEERSGCKKLNPIKFVRDSSNAYPNKKFSYGSTLSAKANTVVATKILLDDANNGFKNGNFVCSPFSLATVLGMLAAGAQGKTLEQLLDFLGHENLDQLLSESPIAILSNPGGRAGRGPDIGLANGIWVDKKLNRVQPCYKEILNSVFNTKARFVDFENKIDDELARKINSWVNKKLTRGLIPTAVEVGDSEDGVVIALTNALYFKGVWFYPFNKNHTKKKRFHLMNGETVQVPFMTSFGELSYCSSFQGYKVLRIPYERDDQSDIFFSMYIFLPDRKDGLHDLLQKVHSRPTLFDIRYSFCQTRFDELRIPKFKISNKFEPKNAMKQMGLTLPFEPMNMELNGILESRNLDSSEMPFYISKILQKSFIEIEEKGTEAVACSIPTMKLGCGRRKTSPPPFLRPNSRFVADHPFMFMIREETSQTVLYIGVVLNPNA